MPLPFSEICTLLERLEDNELHIGLRAAEKQDKAKEIVKQWFINHRRRISELDAHGAAALLSTLLPEWRTDRIYGAQSSKLSSIIKRALALRHSSITILDAYKTPGSGDLATCLVRVLKDLGKPALPPVNVEDIDELLQEWAGLSNFSDPSIPQLPRSSSRMRDENFGNILKRLKHDDGKWIVRLILKDYPPVRIDEDAVFRSFHFLLPDLLHFQRNLDCALAILKTQLREYPEHPDPQSERLFRRQVDERVGLHPVVGIKVGRPKFNKAWSLDYCLKMLGPDQWVVERKYDGEYCEVHVDLTRSQDVKKCIKIFSKSGKESTHDRTGILDTIVECLQLGKPECKLKEQAILLGELVVWSDLEQRVMGFSEIRKHVTRSGRSLGTHADSQPKAHEHLAIVFFDLLLLDDELVMNRPTEERRMWLREAYIKRLGKAMSAEWKQIDFAKPQSKRRLVEQFAAANAERCEGLILKPCGLPYFSIDAPNRSYIKMKKDYIQGLGDEGDFAVIGGSYSAQLAATTKAKNVKWTSFHLGCLTNKEDVCRSRARPIFKYVWTINCDHCIPTAELEAANLVAQFVSYSYDPKSGTGDFDVQTTVPLKMDHAFYPPLVFEVLGSGYQKPSNCSFRMLRHPRVKKTHQDRAWEECVSFQELQQQAADAEAAPIDPDSEEIIEWIERIEGSCKKKLDRDGTLSPKSRRTPMSRSSALSIPEKPSPTKPPGEEHHGKALPTPLPSSSDPEFSSSPLERSTVLQRSRLTGKRKTDEGPDARHDVKKSRSSKARTRLPSPTSSPPLAEISNNAETASAQMNARMCRRSLICALSSSWAPAPCPRRGLQTDSQPDFDASAARCAESRCPLANAVVFVVPCIASTPYVMENLLGLHYVSTVRELVHWDRDSFAHKPLRETVSESQSYPGMHKIVVVEERRHPAVREVVKKMLALNQGRFKERIDVYDWRVLEECREHHKGADQLKKHFIGATLFDDTQKRALFVSEREWLDV